MQTRIDAIFRRLLAALDARHTFARTEAGARLVAFLYQARAMGRENE